MKLFSKKPEVEITPNIVAVFVFWQSLVKYRQLWQRFDEVCDFSDVDECCDHLQECENMMDMCLRLLKYCS